MNTTTLITVTTAPKDTTASSGYSLPRANATTEGRYLNTSSSVTNTASRGFHIPFWRMNLTATATKSSVPSRLQAHNVSLVTGTGTPATLNSTGVRPIWLNTSYPLSPNRTVAATPPFLNTTATARWGLNSTAPVGLLANSTVRWANTSATSTIPSSTPTLTFPTSCGGENATGFSLQVAQPGGGAFNNWFVHLSGRGLLFTSRRSSASRFSVESTGHLCVVGLLDQGDLPYVAAVGTRDERSAVWLATNDTLSGDFADDYAALACDIPGVGGSLSCKSTNGTLSGPGSWLGCGIQLALGSEGQEGDNGVGCVGVALGVVDGAAGGSNNGAAAEGVQRTRFERRVMNPFDFGRMSARG